MISLILEYSGQKDIESPLRIQISLMLNVSELIVAKKLEIISPSIFCKFSIRPFKSFRDFLCSSTQLLIVKHVCKLVLTSCNSLSDRILSVRLKK